MRHFLRYAVLVLMLITILTASILYMQGNRPSLEKRIITAADRMIIDEGECSIDLSELFDDVDWDTVSIFIAGNAKQIHDSLCVDNDISDGIVFTFNGKRVMLEMSAYDFLHDELPLISYHVVRTQDDDPYYESRSRDRAILHIKKFMSNSGEYKYLVYLI